LLRVQGCAFKGSIASRSRVQLPAAFKVQLLRVQLPAAFNSFAFKASRSRVQVPAAFKVQLLRVQLPAAFKASRSRVTLVEF